MGEGVPNLDNEGNQGGGQKTVSVEKPGECVKAEGEKENIPDRCFRFKTMSLCLTPQGLPSSCRKMPTFLTVAFTSPPPPPWHVDELAWVTLLPAPGSPWQASIS